MFQLNKSDSVKEERISFHLFVFMVDAQWEKQSSAVEVLAELLSEKWVRQ